MVRAAERAAAGLMRDFARLESLLITVKRPSDFVSSADLEAQETLRSELASACPTHGFLLEEGASPTAPAAEARFIIDPLDGTTNFLHGIPQFSISIALEAKGEIVAGVVLNPASAELFWAEKDEGAWLGDRRLRVSRRTQLDHCVAGTGIPHLGRPSHDAFLAALARIMPLVAGVRRLGSAALDLAFVAAGRFDFFWEIGLAPWDVAAAQLLVREAGGVVTKCDGQPMHIDDGDVLATNGEPLHRTVVGLLAAVHRQTRGPRA